MKHRTELSLLFFRGVICSESNTNTPLVLKGFKSLSVRSAGDIIFLHIEINTQMHSLYLQEENALFEGTENKILWYFRFRNSSYFDKNFPTVSQIQIIVCTLATCEHVPLIPTAFVAEPMHDFMHLTDTLSPYYIISGSLGRTSLASPKPAWI